MNFLARLVRSIVLAALVFGASSISAAPATGAGLINNNIQVDSSSAVPSSQTSVSKPPQGSTANPSASPSNSGNLGGVSSVLVGQGTAAPSLTIGNDTGLKGFVNYLIITFLKPASVAILALAVIWFLWNIARVIGAGDDPKQWKNLRQRSVWGIVAIAVMVSLWALVTFFTQTFFQSNAIIPHLNTNPKTTDVLSR